MTFMTWPEFEEKYSNIAVDESAFDFDNSVVKYNRSNTTNTYMGPDGIIVLAQEKIEIGHMTFTGPFHSLGHFLEAPDKWCNKPYFGFLKNSTYFWPREGRATLIHIAILNAFGFEFDWSDWESIYATLAWYYGERWRQPEKHEIEAIKPRLQDEIASWTKERILSEWNRKNKLIENMPKERPESVSWGMFGAVAA